MNTLSALRATIPPPTIAIEVCDICKHIPAYCRRYEKGGEVQHDDIPPQVEKLVVVNGPLHRCPTCDRLYLYDSEYEFIYGGSEDTYEWTRVTHEEAIRHELYLPLRFAACDQLGSPRRLSVHAHPQWFPEHVLVHAYVGEVLKEREFIAVFADDAPAFELTLETLPRILDVDPPKLDDVTKYALAIDRWTTGAKQSTIVKAFEEVPFAAKIEDLRAASRVEPLVVEKHGNRHVLRYWVATDNKLICRVLTVSARGDVTREDALIGEAI